MAEEKRAEGPIADRVIFENERVRVLEYTDQPGDMTMPHEHPDSVMYTLSSFQRRLHHAGATRDVEIAAGGRGGRTAGAHADVDAARATRMSGLSFISLHPSSRRAAREIT